MVNHENMEFTDIYDRVVSEADNFGPLSHILKLAKSMQQELRERPLSEDDEMIFAMGAIAMFNELLDQSDESDMVVFYMQRVFKHSKFAEDGMADLSGEHQAIGHPRRFIYRRIRNLPTYSVVAQETELYSYDRPTPSLYSPREELVLPVKAIDSVRRDISIS